MTLRYLSYEQYVPIFVDISKAIFDECKQKLQEFEALLKDLEKNIQFLQSNGTPIN